MTNYYQLFKLTSNDKRWTSVTSHHAHAHPPTRVFFDLDPQQPPKIKLRLVWSSLGAMQDGYYCYHIAIYIRNVYFTSLALLNGGRSEYWMCQNIPRKTYQKRLTLHWARRCECYPLSISSIIIVGRSFFNTISYQFLLCQVSNLVKRKQHRSLYLLRSAVLLPGCNMHGFDGSSL